MINISIEVNSVKPVVFKSGLYLEDEEKRQVREFFEKNLLPVFSQIRGRR